MIATIDFETEAIIKSSPKSPMPVGVAIKIDNEESKYYAFGHPVENNSKFEDVYDILHNLWVESDTLLFHNAKFDMRICMEWFSLPFSCKCQDTMLLAFIRFPREETLGLKPLSEKYLNWPPNEKNDLDKWIVNNVKEATLKNAGAFICKAPGNLVGEYAKGDVDRTFALYNFLIKGID